MLLGVISDTHGLLRPEAVEALRGAQQVIHAGDVGSPEILKKLATIAPVTAVRGNVDKDTWAQQLPETQVLETGGISIYLLHDLTQLDVKPEAAGFRVVISGHSHIPKQEVRNGVLYFNPGSAETYFKQQKLPTFKARGYTLYAFGSGAGPTDLFFLFIDSNTAAFGHRKLLEKMVEIRFGGEEGLLRNDQFYPLINDANGTGTVWAVLNPAYTRLAMQQLAPEIQQFPEAAKLVTRMRNMIISVDASGALDGKFQAICGSTEDANTLGQLLQAGFLYKHYQAQQDNPEMAQLLDSVRITPAGDRVVLRMTLSNDQVTSLIRKNTFAFKM